MNDPGFIRYLDGFGLSKEAFLALPATDQVTYRSAWQDERRKQEAHQAVALYVEAANLMLALQQEMKKSMK